jgi:hypothetical protein
MDSVSSPNRIQLRGPGFSLSRGLFLFQPRVASGPLFDGRMGDGSGWGLLEGRGTRGEGRVVSGVVASFCVGWRTGWRWPREGRSRGERDEGRGASGFRRRGLVLRVVADRMAMALEGVVEGRVKPPASGSMGTVPTSTRPYSLVPGPSRTP